GASETAPENTMAAISAAVEAKADWIEFDVRAIAGGGLFLFHDENLKRFGGGEKKIDSLADSEIGDLDVGTWFDPKFSAERPPALRAAISACLDGKTVPLIERKTGSAESYISLIRELDAVEKVVLQAFDWDFLERARQLEPDLKLGALKSEPPTDADWTQLKKLKPEWVGWNQKHLTEDLIRQFQAAGYSVAVWTVNDLARIRKFTEWGVDGLITDRPAEAREAMMQLFESGD
ncbi:MAG: hypothetical protein HKN23_01220, partial [Verrucomicrobiales bacterium]|nr:hypothetical protein [Verrucomicrobiales bacterium]